MDCKTGEIYELTDYEQRALMADALARGAEKERQAFQSLAPMTEDQVAHAAPLPAKMRKGYMRNQPCVCGSAKKFKRCCWNKYAASALPDIAFPDSDDS